MKKQPFGTKDKYSQENHYLCPYKIQKTGFKTV